MIAGGAPGGAQVCGVWCWLGGGWRACARHLHIGRCALRVGADELFAGAAVAHRENRGNKVEHFQRVRLVLVEEVHAVGHFHDVGAVRVRIVLQDKLGGGR